MDTCDPMEVSLLSRQPTADLWRAEAWRSRLRPQTVTPGPGSGTEVLSEAQSTAENNGLAWPTAGTLAGQTVGLSGV